MTPDEKSVLKSEYPEHHFLRIIHPLGEAVMAIPKKQPTPEREAAAELYHGATVRIGNAAQD